LEGSADKLIFLKCDMVTFHLVWSAHYVMAFWFLND